MKLHTYLNEIFDIAHEANKTSSVSWDVGKDMFLTNVQAGKAVYPGADGVDYAALQPHYQKLVETGADFVAAVQDHYAEIVDLRAQGKRAEAVALIGG